MALPLVTPLPLARPVAYGKAPQSPANPEPSPANNPLHWDLSKVVPVTGVGVSLLWGLANIAEHQLHEATPLGRGLLKGPLVALAVAAPAVNVAYGGINATAAAMNGYGWRTVAFTAYTLGSAALALLLLKDNHQALKLSRELAEKGFAHLDDALKNAPFKQWFNQTFTAKDANRRAWASVASASLPIGAMLGLFTMTKAAQSSSTFHLQHPVGSSVHSLLTGTDPERQQQGDDWWTTFKRNLKGESHTVATLIKDTPQVAKTTAHDIHQGWQHLLNPHTATTNADGTLQDATLAQGQNAGAWQRFATPIMAGEGVALTYAWTGVGRLGAAAAALTLAGTGAKHLLAHNSPFAKLDALQALGEATPNLLQKSLKWGMGQSMLVGQFAGSLSALFTRFGDWPMALSSVYRVSSLPYLVSGLVAAKAPLPGVKFLAKQLDWQGWAKLGAFVQASAYMANLAFNQPAETSPAKPLNGQVGAKNS